MSRQSRRLACRLRRVLAGGAAAIALACAAPRPALAQELIVPEILIDESGSAASVFGRVRPEYDPQGVRLGTYLLFPTLQSRVTWTDNLFNQAANVESDWIFNVRPGLVARSDFPRHALDFRIQGSGNIHFDNTDEDTFDFLLQTLARLDIYSSTTARGEITLVRRTETRGSPSEVGGQLEPAQFDTFRAESELRHRFNRLRVALGLRSDEVSFTSVDLAAFPFRLDNSDRDFTDRRTWAELSYELSPETFLFVRGTLNEHDFDRAFDRNGFDRDSDGYDIVAGMEFGATQLWVGRAFVGWQDQTFEDPLLGDVDGFAFGADLEWNPTGLTTVRLYAEQALENTTLAFASAINVRHAGIGVDHELLYNLLLRADLSYADRDFEGIPRQDDVWFLDLEARYLIAPEASISLAYGLTDRSSTNATSDFTTNRIGAVLRLRI